ncbi:hypothetical protein Taro_051929 [Colocasia esculenta]|uniref:Uncharacterized protein n=1 Tax=Colocasia esculenta TaxID=4460 RepID=A0A843XHA5_COLES|nr:hypothetical protein [Colocasia esculenta]
MNRARSSFDQKPPLAVSPRRLRPRRGRTEASAAAAAPRTSPAPSPKDTQHLRRSCPALAESPLKTEYEKISRELKAREKRAEDDFPNGDALRAIAVSAQAAGLRSIPLFERGRLYEVYSARRNERLKRKMEETFEEEAEAAPARRSAVDAEVAVKRRSTTRTNSLRMSAPEGLPAVGRTPSLRSSLRSSTRENKMASVLRSAVKYADEEGRRASARVDLSQSE